MARTGEFIYLRTRGYLDVDQDSNEVRSFVCHNVLVDEDEGKRLVKEMKKKFAIMIQETEFSSLEPETPAVENPVQLERAILRLITNLHSTSTCGDDMVLSPSDTQSSTDDHESDSNRSVKSPPLALIAPKISTIKTSITKSVHIVEHASQGIKNSDFDDKQYERDTKIKNISRPTVLKRGKNITSEDENCGVDRTTNKQSLQNYSSPRQVSNETLVSQTITIKQEQPDYYRDSRVPPLPTSAGYFDETPHSSTQYMENLSSPIECKPFDIIQFNQDEQQDNATGGWSQRYDNIGDNERLNYADQSIGVGTSLKRTRSTDELDNANTKRRLYENISTNDDDDSPSQYDANLTLSLHDACINQLTDSNLGEKFKTEIFLLFMLINKSTFFLLCVVVAAVAGFT